MSAIRKLRIPFTERQLDRIHMMYISGKSLIAISDVFGISVTAVSARLRAMGHPVRSRGAPKKITDEMLKQIILMREQKIPWLKIKEVTGLNINHMCKLVADHKRSKVAE